MLPSTDVATSLLAAACLLLLAGSIPLLLLGRTELASRLAFAPAAAAAAAALGAALLVLGSGRPVTGSLPAWIRPAGLPSAIRLDAIDAAVLLVSAAMALVAAAGGAGLARRVSGTLAGSLHVHLLAQIGVLTADDAPTLVLSLGVLAVSLWALLSCPGDDRAAAAGPELMSAWILALGLVSGALLLLAAHAGDARLDAIAAAAPALPGTVRATAFLLLLLGLGVMSGALPLFDWLARGQAAAAPVAAPLLVASVPALALVTLLRACLEWLSPLAAWSAALALFAGTLALLGGAYRAVAEPDLARIAAHVAAAGSGTRLIVLGAAVALAAAGHEDPARLALTATVYGLLVHAVVTAGLALVAAGVARAAGTTDLDRLSGPGAGKPVWTLAFLLVAAAAASLPPTGGFAAARASFETTGLAARAADGAAVRAAALAALAAMAFAFSAIATALLRVTATILPGRPGGDAGAGSRPPPVRVATAALLGLGLASLATGVLSGPIGTEVHRLRFAAEPAARAAPAGPAIGALPALADLAALLLLGLLAAALFLRRPPLPPRRAQAALGATPGPELAASAFAQPFVSLHRSIYGAEEEAEILEGDSAGFPRRIRVTWHRLPSPVRAWRRLAARLAAALAPTRAPGRLQGKTDLAILLLVLAALLLLVR